MINLLFRAYRRISCAVPAPPTRDQLAGFIEEIGTGGLKIKVGPLPQRLFHVVGTEAFIGGYLARHVYVQFDDETMELAKFALAFLEHFYPPGALAAVILYAYEPTIKTRITFNLAMYGLIDEPYQDTDAVLPNSEEGAVVLRVACGEEKRIIIIGKYDKMRPDDYCEGFKLYPQALDEQMEQLKI